MTVKLPRASGAARTRHHQRGMSIWFLLIIGALVVIVGGAALRIVPTYLEFMGVQTAVEAAAEEGGDARNIRKVFNRNATIENITSITGDDLVIERTDSGSTISFAYERRLPLAGPINILMDYRGSAVAKR